MDSSVDGISRTEKARPVPGSNEPQRTILFACAENVSGLREEHYGESFSSDALKTYLKHIGYYKGKKRRRCLSMELDRLRQPEKDHRDNF